MPAHIYFRTGDYAAAVKSNLEAIKAEEEYQRRQPNPPPGIMGYSNHNFQQPRGRGVHER